MTFLNQRRLHDYPFLMLITTSIVVFLNLFFHQGWRGGFGQIIGSDFITLYGAGLIVRSDPGSLYDFDTQRIVQENLVAPTTLEGINPFISPPYVAYAYGLLTLLPLRHAFVVWSCLMILCAFISAFFLSKVIIQFRVFNFRQLLVITFSFFPFLEGLMAGQNHGLTLLLVTISIVALYKGQNYLAGIAAGLLIYKPQLVFGLLIVWIVWKNFKALFGFACIAFVWAGTFLFIYGATPFLEYLETSRLLLLLPYQPGFPGYLIITVYGFFSTIFPHNYAGFFQWFTQILFVLTGGLLAWIAYKQRNSSKALQIPVLAAAILYPLAMSPYVQLHDLLIVIPVFVGWSIYDRSTNVLSAAIIIYLGCFFLTLLAAITGIAWMALLSIGLFVAVMIWNIKQTGSFMIVQGKD
jgi:hypothetical protein